MLIGFCKYQLQNLLSVLSAGVGLISRLYWQLQDRLQRGGITLKCLERRLKSQGNDHPVHPCCRRARRLDSRLHRNPDTDALKQAIFIIWEGLCWFLQRWCLRSLINMRYFFWSPGQSNSQFVLARISSVLKWLSLLGPCHQHRILTNKGHQSRCSGYVNKGTSLLRSQLHLLDSPSVSQA